MVIFKHLNETLCSLLCYVLRPSIIFLMFFILKRKNSFLNVFALFQYCVSWYYMAVYYYVNAIESARSFVFLLINIFLTMYPIFNFIVLGIILCFVLVFIFKTLSVVGKDRICTTIAGLGCIFRFIHCAYIPCFKNIKAI